MEEEQVITFVSKSIEAVKTFVKDVVTNAYGIENTVMFLAAIALLSVLLWERRFSLAIYLAIQSAVICGVSV